jgi:peroxiredoxin
MRRLTTGAAAVVTLCMVPACGSAPEPGSTHSPTAPSSTVSRAAIAVTYEGHDRTSDGPSDAHIDLVAVPPDHVRYALKQTGYPQMLFVYDGTRLLVHDPEESQPWSLYEKPEEHPDQFAVSDLFTAPGSAEFAKGCPSAKPLGHKRILGRNAAGYHCAAHFLADGSGTFAFTEWLDQKTNVLLESDQIHATSFDEHPDITAATFSTTAPAGAKVAVYAARQHAGDPPKKAAAFDLNRVTGTSGTGTVSLSDYTDKPVVLAFFSSDLAFGDEDCAGCLDALAALTQLTHGGTNPAVLAVQDGEEGKPGYPLIPKGLHVDVVVNDPASDVQHAYGLDGQVGFAFIGADGKVHQVFNKAPTDQQLKDAVDAIR